MKPLKGFDDYMAQVLEDWNAPGVCVGVVMGEELVFAQGYSYRDYAQKLPFTPTTLHPIASNTKLFTAIAAGLLVEAGTLTWDEPVSKSVPGIAFYNDDLYKTVTVRDMLSHRTDFTRKPETVAPDILKQSAGEYETPDKYVLKVIYREDKGLFLAAPGVPEASLLPYKGLAFRHEHFSDVTVTFLRENGQITAMKQSDPSGEQTFPRKTSR